MSNMKLKNKINTKIALKLVNKVGTLRTISKNIPRHKKIVLY